MQVPAGLALSLWPSGNLGICAGTDCNIYPNQSCCLPACMMVAWLVAAWARSALRYFRCSLRVRMSDLSQCRHTVCRTEHPHSTELSMQYKNRNWKIEQLPQLKLLPLLLFFSFCFALVWFSSVAGIRWKDIGPHKWEIVLLLLIIWAQRWRWFSLYKTANGL